MSGCRLLPRACTQHTPLSTSMSFVLRCSLAAAGAAGAAPKGHFRVRGFGGLFNFLVVNGARGLLVSPCACLFDCDLCVCVWCVCETTVTVDDYPRESPRCLSCERVVGTRDFSKRKRRPNGANGTRLSATASLLCVRFFLFCFLGDNDAVLGFLKLAAGAAKKSGKRACNF